MKLQIAAGIYMIIAGLIAYYREWWSYNFLLLVFGVVLIVHGIKTSRRMSAHKEKVRLGG